MPSISVNCASTACRRGTGGKIFLLLLAALENLEKDACPARVARCFELNLLEELGLRPALEACSSCGSKEGPFISIRQEGACFVPAAPGRTAVFLLSVGPCVYETFP